MSTFEPEWPGMPSEDDISAFLSDLSDDGPVNARRHPYDRPAQDRPRRPSWRGGPRLDRETELAYRAEQDDQ